MLISVAHGEVGCQPMEVDRSLDRARHSGRMLGQEARDQPGELVTTPPLAMPGLPVVFTASRPSGWAITVRAPFSTRVTPNCAAKPRATSSRRA